MNYDCLNSIKKHLCLGIDYFIALYKALLLGFWHLKGYFIHELGTTEVARDVFISLWHDRIFSKVDLFFAWKPLNINIVKLVRFHFSLVYACIYFLWFRRSLNIFRASLNRMVAHRQVSVTYWIRWKVKK